MGRELCPVHSDTGSSESLACTSGSITRAPVFSLLLSALRVTARGLAQFLQAVPASLP